MPAYLIRMKKDGNDGWFKHRLVGFFCVETFNDLTWIVDEDLDPTHCEAARLTNGGILFVDRATKTPIPEDLSNDYIDNGIGEPTLTEDWGFALTGDRPLRWRPLLWRPLLPSDLEH